MVEDTSTASDNPAATQDVANEGDALSQMVAGQYDKHGAAPSEGEPSSTTEPTTQADETGRPEGDVTEPDKDGKVTRLEQDLASQKKAFLSLGIDPESDAIEKFNAGLISREQLLDIVQQPAPKEAPQEVSAFEKLAQHRTNIQEKISKGEEIMQQDYLRGLDIMADLASENLKVTQQANIDNLIGQCKNAAEAVIDTDELHTALPENIREIEAQMFLSSTDSLLGEKTNGDQRYWTPQAYTFYAKENMESFNTLRNAWIDYGRNLEKPKPPPTVPTVNPISSEAGGSPMAQPKEMIKLDNMAEAARNYQKQRAII